MVKKLDAYEADLQLTKLENEMKYHLERGHFEEADFQEVLDFTRECIALLDVYEDTINYYKNIINNITEQINELLP